MGKLACLSTHTQPVTETSTCCCLTYENVLLFYISIYFLNLYALLVSLITYVLTTNDSVSVELVFEVDGFMHQESNQTDRFSNVILMKRKSKIVCLLKRDLWWYLMMCEVKKSLQSTSLSGKKIFGTLIHFYSTPIMLLLFFCCLLVLFRITIKHFYILLCDGCLAYGCKPR